MRPVTNSEITTFQTCQRLWQYAYFERRTGFTRPEVLDRGTRMHAVISTCRVADEGRGAAIGSLPLPERAMMHGYFHYNGGFGEVGYRHLLTNVPFIVRLGHVDVVGEVDALGVDADGSKVIFEDKTTSHDIAPGSAWWREKVSCDTQPTVYSAAFPGHKVLYNVLHVPDMEPKKATPVEDRKYTKPKKDEPSRLYAVQRDRDETDGEYMARVLADMAENPGKYFQRGTVVRLDRDIEEYTEDLRLVSRAMSTAMVDARESSMLLPRTPKACHAWGRPCEFIDACWHGKDIALYQKVERNHSEEIMHRLEMYQAKETVT